MHKPAGIALVRQLETEEREWLGLSEASRFLGVHPTTLRAWANQGQVRAFRTPGGHRRFSQQDLQRFVAARQSRETPAPAGLVQHLLSHTRRDLAQNPNLLSIWQEQHDEAARDMKRESGRRLLGLTIQYLARERGRTAILQEARAIGATYGRDAAGAGMPLAHTARIILFFRDSLDQAIRQHNGSGAVADGEETRLQRDLYYFLDEVLLAALNAYESILHGTTTAESAEESPP
jgi:excisionase family DNA binding protein